MLQSVRAVGRCGIRGYATEKIAANSNVKCILNDCIRGGEGDSDFFWRGGPNGTVKVVTSDEII